MTRIALPRSLIALIAVCSLAGAILIVVKRRHDAGWIGWPGSTGPVEPTELGMTLGGLSYWSAEWPFDDPIRSTATIKLVGRRGWEDIDGQLKEDDTGHPIDVPTGTRLAVIIQLDAPHSLAGSFDCRMSPGWRIERFGDWRLRGSPTAFRIMLPSPKPGTAIALLLTAASNHAALTELRCRRPGQPDRLFNPQFLAELRPFRVVRFMEWMRANDAPPSVWNERASPAAFSQGGAKGVALDYIVALANQAHVDPWINLPLDADPSYYRQTAAYVRAHLAPDQRVYVEVSNEVWNDGFPQGREAIARGLARYPAVTPQQASDYYYGDRVRAVMAIWSEVFADRRDRLVRVLASQAANPRRARQALSHLDTWRSVDALATAPYFGTDGETLTAPPGKARVDAIMAMGPELVDAAIDAALAAKRVAHHYGLRYVTYEAGPGFASYRPDLRDDLAAVNRDPRMFGLYRRFLDEWRRRVGGLLVLFDQVSGNSPGGSYGHRLYTGQPLGEAPKARAVESFAASLPR